MADEFDFTFTKDAADPKPGDKKAPRVSANGKRLGRPPKETKTKEISEQIEMMITVASIPWAMRDPHCGGALQQQAKPIADALAVQALNSPRLMKWLEAITSPTGWIGIAIAVEPVAQAVVQHHVLPRFASRYEQEDEGLPSNLNVA